MAKYTKVFVLITILAEYIPDMKCMHFFFILLGASHINAQQTLKRIDGSVVSAATLDSALPEIMKQAKVVALDIVVVNEAKPAYSHVFGLRDREAALPADTNTVFEAASLTKPLFAYLAMSLVKEQILHLDTPLYKYLEYEDIAHDPRHKLVTARMVLSHSSGLSSGRNAGRLEFVYDPGKYFNYSPEGIFYLQLVIEKLLNKKLEVIMKERVFDPLQMIHSSLVWTEATEKNYTIGYDYFEKRVQKWKPDLASAMSTLQTTAGDYARFLREMMRGSVLGKEFLSLMLTPQIQVIAKDTTLWWSLGFGVDKTTSKPAYFQWGSNLGVQNLVVFYPTQQIGVVYFVNGEHGLQIKDALLALTVGGKYSTDKFLTYDQYNSFTRQLTKGYDHGGVSQTLRLYTQLKKKYKSNVTNRQLDELAAYVLGKGKVDDAIKMLQLNTSFYPKSWKTYSALAEIYLNKNDHEKYLASLIRAIKYSPNPELLLYPLQQTGIKWR